MYLHPDTVTFFKNDVSINKWIEEQVPLYQGLKIKPIWNNKVRYVPTLTVDSLNLLKDIAGRTPSRQVNNLYWDMIMRDEKRKRRYEILHKFFPKN